MSSPLTYPVFLYGFLGMLGLGTVLSESKYGLHNAFLLCGFYVVAILLQKWFFDTRHMSGKKSKTEAVDQIIFAGEPLETEAEAAHEKRTLDKVLQLPVQIRLRLCIFGMVGAYVSLILNHTFQMHFSLLFHLITALLILPAMTPNHFMLPLAVNLMAVGYAYAKAETPDIYFHSIYVLVFIFVLMAFGNVQREVKQTRPRAFALTQLTVRTVVNAAQQGVAFLLLLGLVDYFVPRAGQSQQQKTAAVRNKVTQLQAMIGRAMPESFRPEPGPSGAPKPTGSESEQGMKAQPSPNAPDGGPSSQPSIGPHASPSPSGHPSSGPSARPSVGPNPEKPPEPPKFPLPSTLPSLSPKQVQDLAKEALKQGLFDEKDLKRGELNLKPEVQKLLTPERIQEAMKQLEQMGKSPQGPKPKFDPAALADAAFPGDGKQPAGSKTTPEREGMKDILNKVRAALADAKGTGKSGNSAPKPGASPDGGSTTQAQSGSGGGGGSKQNAGGGGGGGSNPKPTPTPSPKIKKDLPTLVDELLTPVLVALVVIAAWFFRRKLKKKVDPKRISRLQLAREQRAEILKRLRELGHSKLSARDEVIARYDLFLRIMELAATPRESYLPPTDYQRRIRYLHPPLEGQSKTITDVFCDVFYGEYPVGTDSVKGIRGAVTEVYHYFAD